MTSNRHLSFPNLLNARDLGGCPTQAGSLTRWKSLIRADELSRLTPAGAQAIWAYGVRTVIDLRWPDEVKARPVIFQEALFHINYVPISLLGPDEAPWRLLRPKATKALWNCVVLDYAKPQICQVMRTIVAAQEGAVLFFCESGKDRTGLIAALLLTLAGVEPVAIAHDYALTTEKLRAAYLAANPSEVEATLERVRCPPARVYNMLAYLTEHYTDIAGYLYHIGLRENEISELRGRLL
ncbi:MAG: tyrosine-protein phosphatase [Caldilineaceae bacterium]